MNPSQKSTVQGFHLTAPAFVAAEPQKHGGSPAFTRGRRASALRKKPPDINPLQRWAPAAAVPPRPVRYAAVNSRFH